jgi:hypothetical protein
MDEAQKLQLLLDRQEILDCLLRYTRGVDRADPDLIRSAFHPDAMHCQGPVSGNANDFLEWWLPSQESREVTQHFLTNHTAEVDGDVAHAESYFIGAVRPFGVDRTQLVGGRYADRLERRGGVWRIAVRVVLADWAAPVDSSGMEAIFAVMHTGSRDASDPTYERPLEPRPARGPSS